MNKDEKNAKLAQIAKIVEDRGIKINGKVIIDSLTEAWNLGYKEGYAECEDDEKVGCLQDMEANFEDR